MSTTYSLNFKTNTLNSTSNHLENTISPSSLTSFPLCIRSSIFTSIYKFPIPTRPYLHFPLCLTVVRKSFLEFPLQLFLHIITIPRTNPERKTVFPRAAFLIRHFFALEFPPQSRLICVKRREWGKMEKLFVLAKEWTLTLPLVVLKRGEICEYFYFSLEWVIGVLWRWEAVGKCGIPRSVDCKCISADGRPIGNHFRDE